MNAQQERLLNRIDDLIDSAEVEDAAMNGISLHSYISRSPKHRMACIRAFGGVIEALTAYGYYDDTRSEINYRQLLNIMAPMIVLSEADKPFLPEHEKDYLSEIFIFDKIMFRECYEEAKDYKRLEMIEDYIEHGGIIPKLFDRENRSVSGGLSNAAYKLFGSAKKLCEYFGITYEMVSMQENPIKFFGDAGRDFERAVLEIFEECGVSVIYNRQQVDGCRPDFVLSDRWADTKLSKSTVFSGADRALVKYPKHTDKLDIIYAIDDMPDEEVPELPEGVRLVSVFDYFNEIPADAKAKIERIIEESNEKRTRRWMA